MVMEVKRTTSGLQQSCQNVYPKPVNKILNQNEEIAKEYREACQNDSSIEHTLNTKTKYHIVSAIWMNKFISFATSSSSTSQTSTNTSVNMDLAADEKKSESIGDGDSDSKHPGKICNSCLLSIENTDSQIDHQRDHSIKTEVNHGNTTNSFMFPLKPGLSHGKEFAVVGPNAWRVISNKFGFDYNLERPIKIFANETASVEIYPKNAFSSTAKIVPLPLGGRWDLPKCIRSKNEISDEYSAVNDLFPFSENPSNEPTFQSTTHTPSQQQLALIPLNDTNNYDSRVENPPARKKIKKMGRCGLTNLGNTCFMNSSLQCLAHTTPLRNYFLSNEYKMHLNHDNPLGTGGELATEFAKLLQQMWGRNTNYTPTYDRYYTENALVVTPRNFKLTLGRNASQFIGYDQHDSQELATYLLDALHEDTNLVTKKPYVEKTEKKDGEGDNVAAERAWREYLERDDSRIVDSFMGQVKSRVQCPTKDCGRVSTTFDPYMYLSVPIPGSQDRTIELFFAFLDPLRRKKKIKVTLLKSSTILTLQEKIGEKVGVPKEDIIIADVWKNEVYSIYKSTSDVGMLKDSDDIFAFELKASETITTKPNYDESNENYQSNMDGKMDDDIIVEITFTKEKTGFQSRYNQMQTNGCHSFASPLLMRIPRQQTIRDFRKEVGIRLRGILNATMFAHDRTKALEEKAEKEEIWSDGDKSEYPPLPTSRANPPKHIVEEFDKDETKSFGDEKKVASKIEDMNSVDEKVSEDAMSYGSINDKVKQMNYQRTLALHESGETILMRSIPLTYQRKSPHSNYNKKPARRLGELERTENPSNKFRLTSPMNELESQTVSAIVGNAGRVSLYWEAHMLNYFNITAWEAIDDDHSDDSDMSDEKKDEPITLQKCIESFCKKEQLEESEKWYCNNCKTHVRAWKQFHLYSAAPILIIQLKRFYFSSSSHRRDKIGTFIDFPLNGLDLRSTVMNWEEGEEPIYDCYAVSNHYGGLGGGHYTAYAKNNGQWCYFDDSRVTEVKDEKEVVSEAAYVLYYRRSDLEDWDKTFSGSVGSSSPLSTTPSSLSPPVGEISINSQDADSPRSVQSGYPQDMEIPDKEMDSISSSANVTQVSCGSPIESVSEDEIDDSQMKL